jgi:hypothetical protein
VELTACPRCSSPLSPGQATCPVCGIPIALEAPGPSASQTASAGALPAAPGAGQGAVQHLSPSAGSATLGSIGAARPGVPAGPALRPGFEVGPNVLPGLDVAAQGPATAAAPHPNGPAPALAQPQPNATSAAPGPQGASAPPAVAQAAAPQSAASTAKAYLGLFTTWLGEISALPKNELAARSLIGLGGALALISFFLPWANSIGMGVGTMDPNPRPGAWGFDTPAGWPIFIITALMLATVVGSDKAQEIMPDLATTIRRSTWIVVPMTLGGGLLGVATMYLTLPYGCGGGLVAIALGACLLIAGSVVGLFLPPAGKQA